MRILSKITVFGLLILSLVSCEKDENNSPAATVGNILVTTTIPNPDGYSGAAYLQLIDDLEPKGITNTNSFPAPYSNVVCVYDDDVFVLPGFGGEALLTKYTRTNGDLVKTGEYILEENSGATNVVVKGDKMYVSCQIIGKILILKHADMTFVKEIDISSYGVGDLNPDPASMIVRGNLLYIGLSQAVGGYFPSPDRPYTDVLIINIDNDEIVKMITSTTPGISSPTRPIDPNSIFMDEKNDLYIVCMGSFGAVPGHNPGILRINSGETEFDDSYYFDLSNANVEGENNKMDYLHMNAYYKDGILYSTGNFPAYYSEPMNPVSDRTVVPVEIDLYAKTVKTLDFPYSNNIGRSVTIYDDVVIFGLSTNTDVGLYTYNLTTKKGSSSAVVTTEGGPSFLSVFD